MIMDAEDKHRIMHADLIINGGEIMLSDPFPEFGPAAVTPPTEAKTTTVSIHLQVNDCEKWWARATAAGCEIIFPLADQFWGDRFGMIRIPTAMSGLSHRGSRKSAARNSRASCGPECRLRIAAGRFD
ncbi:MAG: glyoxalase/bleomycin resistance/extradiol dioxygenase family protein [Parvularculaceae bacterium]